MAFNLTRKTTSSTFNGTTELKANPLNKPALNRTEQMYKKYPQDFEKYNVNPQGGKRVFQKWFSGSSMNEVEEQANQFVVENNVKFAQTNVAVAMSDTHQKIVYTTILFYEVDLVEDAKLKDVI